MFDFIKQLYGCKKVYGPYDGPDGRKRCVLYFDDLSTSSRSYAKLQLEYKLGRKLTDLEEADHVDNDPSNDVPHNLQPLAPVDNKIKHVYNKLEDTGSIGLYCGNCNSPFLLSPSVRDKRLKRSTSGILYCSIECARHAVGDTNKEKLSITNDVRNTIVDLLRQNVSIAEITARVNVSTFTVRKVKRESGL